MTKHRVDGGKGAVVHFVLKREMKLSAKFQGNYPVKHGGQRVLQSVHGRIVLAVEKQGRTCEGQAGLRRRGGF